MEVTATKRQLTLLPNLDFGDKNLRARIIKEEIIESGIASRAKETKRSKSKENNTQTMKKGMKRSHTQCSVEKLHLKDDFLSQMKAD
jgi:glycerol-3-phosphate O-acyltransferase